MSDAGIALLVVAIVIVLVPDLSDAASEWVMLV